MKNLQFLANQAQTLAILPNHEMVILTKFYNDWMKIVDFSLIPYFKASPIFYYSLSTFFLQKQYQLTKYVFRHMYIQVQPIVEKSKFTFAQRVIIVLGVKMGINEINFKWKDYLLYSLVTFQKERNCLAKVKVHRHNLIQIRISKVVQCKL